MYWRPSHTFLRRTLAHRTSAQTPAIRALFSGTQSPRTPTAPPTKPPGHFLVRRGQSTTSKMADAGVSLGAEERPVAPRADGKVLNVEDSIKVKLTELLQPTFLEVVNESHLHSHHSAMRAIGGGSGETHFAVRIISPAFAGLGRIARHRKVYAALTNEFTERGLHALSLKTFTPEESRLEQS